MLKTGVSADKYGKRGNFSKTGPVTTDEPLLSDVATIGKISIVHSLLDVVCQTTGMGFAAIARVTDTRWIACAVLDKISFGLAAGGELEIKTTICDEIRENRRAVLIDHVDLDEHFCNHHTPKLYGFQSYISVPIIRKNGEFFGTLCAIDPKPAQVNNPKIIGMFTLFADLISYHLSTIEELESSEKKLKEERRISELREQFIAVLGHDLRNPLSAIANSAQLQLRMSHEEDTLELAGIIKSSAYRMSKMIENILDFAHGRLGGGLVLNYGAPEPLETVLNQVIAECRTIWPQRRIDVRYHMEEPVDCDGQRIAQLFSNLLSNAITYSKEDTTIVVEATSKGGAFSLIVINSGQRIPEATLKHIFHPFVRGEVTQGHQGLGLGLYIASEIAKAHMGTLQVQSTAENTQFTLTIPNRPNTGRTIQKTPEYSDLAPEESY